MSLKKYIALIVVVFALSAGAFFSEQSFIALRNTSPTESPDISPEVKPPEVEVRPQSQPQLQRQGPAPATSATQPAPNVTLSVGGSTYPVYAPEQSTVLDVMKTLALGGTFSFTSKDFPGMGAFIDSIGGKENSDGYYWILYVNGKSSDTGASQTTLKEGDFIEWKYEKGY